MDKQHLLLDWHLDCNTGRLTCTMLDGDLVYEAIAGGRKDYTKTYLGVTTTIDAVDPDAWVNEKHWISNLPGSPYGVYQPDHERQAIEPKTGIKDFRSEGLGADGEYIDHLQRSQYLLEAQNMSEIAIRFWDGMTGLFDLQAWHAKPRPNFYTPDGGLTIYKCLPTTKTYYFSPDDPVIYDKDNPENDNPNGWVCVMPCMKQPHISGFIKSSYAELEIAQFPSEIIDLCKAGNWSLPIRPELNRHFTLPNENTFKLTDDNVFLIHNDL